MTRLCNVNMTYVAPYDLVVDEHERKFDLLREISILQSASKPHETKFIQMERIAVE